MIKRRKNFIDHTGNVYGELTVLAWVGASKHGPSIWDCVCSCGNTTKAYGHHLLQGKKISCGCKHRTQLGNWNTPTYRSWSNMKIRCYSESHKQFKDYGGRGIYVCDRWVDSFSNFLEDMGERPDGLTLDRIDCDGIYEPSNCRWATRVEQQANKR